MAKSNPIDAVLAAEKDAQIAIDGKRDEAHQIVSDAMSRARAITERTDSRITKIHAHCADAVKSRCDAMWQEYEREPLPLLDQAQTPSNLTQVLQSVAAKLTRADREARRKTDSGDGHE